MKNSLIIAAREFLERFRSRSFNVMLVLGPLLILAFIYGYIQSKNQGVLSMRVLVADPTGLMDNRIKPIGKEGLSYAFRQEYIDIDRFKQGKEFQQYDALVEINEAIFSNKTVKVRYRQTPNVDLKVRMKFEIERRVEECLVSDTLGPQYVGVYSSIKQPLNFHFNDVNDLYNKAEQDVSWLGYSLGYVMIVFLIVFGTNIARSITREKANRISEVLLASVKPFELMMGKILGVLWSSLFQLFCWIVLVGLGLWIFQEVLLEDYFNGYLKGVQMSPEEWRQLGMGGYAQVNEGISLFYNQLNYGFLIPNFILFFLSTYWVYASFFTIIGALSGDDADGQQFILPIWLLFGLSIYAGYNATLYPDSAWTSFFAIFPWTSGMVSMVKVTMGVSLSSYLLMLISWSVSMIVGAMMLVLAGRVFKNGILSYSHKLTLSLLFKWLKR